MIEFWQIVWNIAILGVLFWWVWNSHRGVFASKKDVDSCRQAIFEMQQCEYVSKSYALGLYRKFNARMDELESDYSADDDGDRTLAAIKEGATLARESMEAGSKIVLDALTRDGRIAPEKTAAIGEPVNIGEEDYEVSLDPKLPDIIIARNQEAAEQIGDRITDDLMRIMDEKI